MSYIDLAAYQRQPFGCHYEFIWTDRAIRLHLSEIILTIPKLVFAKEVKLAGLGAVDDSPKIRPVRRELIILSLRIHQVLIAPARVRRFIRVIVKASRVLDPTQLDLIRNLLHRAHGEVP